ncbi:hypothetical protein J6590_086793 [Homalodisca vitripennis]|nr:hypothetical protein J6590_086793 [Homalodisca vitripennis]
MIPRYLTSDFHSVGKTIAKLDYALNLTTSCKGNSESLGNINTKTKSTTIVSIVFRAALVTSVTAVSNLHFTGITIYPGESHVLASGDVAWRCLGSTCKASVKTNTDRISILVHKDFHTGRHPRNVSPAHTQTKKTSTEPQSPVDSHDLPFSSLISQQINRIRIAELTERQSALIDKLQSLHLELEAEKIAAKSRSSPEMVNVAVGHAKGLSQYLQEKLPRSTNLFVCSNPSATSDSIINNASDMSKDLTKEDIAFLITGTNDLSRCTPGNSQPELVPTLTVTQIRLWFHSRTGTTCHIIAILTKKLSMATQMGRPSKNLHFSDFIKANTTFRIGAD